MKKFFLFVSISFGTFVFSQEIVNNDTIKEIKTTQIQEVILKTQRKKQFVDKAVYTFNKETLEKAKHAKDLLETLPELQLDPISNTITSTKGSVTLFLINGIEASDTQIRSVIPSEVIKIEYYDIPPARFATRADIIVNIVTRNPGLGYVFGISALSAFNTGFVNGSAYGNYTKDKNDFGVEYSINYRDYDDNHVRNSYKYHLNGNDYTTEGYKQNTFGYTFQNLTLRYTHLVPDNYVFQSKLKMDIFSRFMNENGENLFSENSMLEKHQIYNKSSADNVIPTLDLYYSKNLGKKDELSVNFVGSHFTTNSSENSKEWNNSSGLLVYDNIMKLEAKQTGIVGELAHVHSFSSGKLSSGYRISNTSISNELQNLIGFSDYHVNYLEQYIYTEYSGKKDKFSYRIGTGLTNIHNKSDKTVFDEWSFTPKIVLSYQLKNNQSFRFTSSYIPRSPSSSALSSNTILLAPNIYERGNPFLKSQHTFGNNLIYSFNNKHFDFNANLFYSFINRSFNQYYVLDQQLGGYSLTYENAKNSQRYGVRLTGSYKPFGNSLLVLKLTLSPSAERIKMANGIEIKNENFGNSFVLSSEYKSFSIQYQFNIPVYYLSGAFLHTNENQNHLFASFKHKEWTFTSGMYWIGIPSEYKTKSLPESLVNYSRKNQIQDNKSMLIFGISYDFSKGKKTNLDRKLNNSTTPAATF